MQKQMEPLAISTRDGKIWIEQHDTGQDDPAIVISPDQVSTLIKWLQEAEAELTKTVTN